MHAEGVGFRQIRHQALQTVPFRSRPCPQPQVSAARLARAADAVVLAYLRSPAFLARALDALVLADAAAQALLAHASDAVMLAYLRSPASLALILAALVGADTQPQALLACAPETAEANSSATMLLGN